MKITSDKFLSFYVISSLVLIIFLVGITAILFRLKTDIKHASQETDTLEVKLYDIREAIDEIDEKVDDIKSDTINIDYIN